MASFFHLMNLGIGTDREPRFNAGRTGDLFACKLDRPVLFPGRLTIRGYLSHPRSIDSFADSRNFSLTRNAVSGWALFVKKTKRIFSPWRGQYIVLLNV